MSIQTTLVIFAILAAFGLLAVVAVNIVLDTQEAEAAPSIVGQCASSLKNSSAQFCHNLQP